MKAFTYFMLALMLVALTGMPVYAELALLDPDVRDKQLAQAEKLYAKRDVDGLLKLLKESHLFIIKTDVALKLGRLGANKALPILREYNQRYSCFACSPSGQFGVAVILIENKTTDAQKKALLAVATEPQKKAKHTHSVIDAAGRELSRFDGDDIITALAGVNTYGAQHTVLKLQCKKLSQSNAISKCIAILEAHETPQKAEAAQDILVSFGSAAKLPVEKLKVRVEKRIKSTDPTFTIPKTIRNRCSRILKQIQGKKKANKPDAEKASTPHSSFSKKIAAYVQRFDEKDDRLLPDLAEFKKEQIELKKSGWKPPWKGYKHVRSRADYEKMKTADLAKECFSTSLWAREMFIYDKPAYGILRAGIYHDGFAVLYEREDFWEGMISVYKHLCDKLGETKEEKERMDILFNLQELQHAYSYPAFHQRLSGHERALLQANVAALKAVLFYTTEAKETPDRPFWGAGVAYGLSCQVFALLKRINSKAYSRLLEQIQTIEISFMKPEPSQVASYIRLVISRVEQALATEDCKTKDAGKEHAEQDAPADADKQRR